MDSPLARTCREFREIKFTIDIAYATLDTDTRMRVRRA